MIAFNMQDEKSAVFDQIANVLTSIMQTEVVKQKIEYLEQAKELIIANDLLDNFLDEVVGFQNDRAQEVRVFVVGFIEASCKKDPDNFNKVLVNLNYLFNDQATNVVKKCIQSATQLIRDLFQWVSRCKLNEQLQSTYETWILIKHSIFDLFENTENDGIRTHCIKFMETIVILQSMPEFNHVSVHQDNELDFQSLTNCTVVKADNIEHEAEQVFEQMVQFFESAHISSVNLMALMQSLVSIAKKRTNKFLERVVMSMQKLNNNLPPTLAKSQVSSVQKQLKMQMLILLKHLPVIENVKYQVPIVELLVSLGATQSDINKCFQDARKRGIKIEPIEIEDCKRIKLDTMSKESTSGSSNKPTGTAVKSESKPSIDASALKVSRNDITQALSATSEFLNTKLSSVENVCDLVLFTLLSIPENAPDHFENSYKFIGEPGSQPFIESVCNQLASQLTMAGLGKGVEELMNRFEVTFKKNNCSDKEWNGFKSNILKSIIHEARKLDTLKQGPSPSPKSISTGKNIPTIKTIKQFNFAEITKEASEVAKFKIVFDSLKRIMDEEDKQFFTSSQLQTRINIVAHLAVEFCEKYPQTLEMVRDYAFSDLRVRLDLLVTILQKSYNSAVKQQNIGLYEHVLACILNVFETQVDPKDKDMYLPKLYMELPYISDESLQIFKRFILASTNSQCITNAFKVLKHLIEKIGELRYKLLDFILKLCLTDEPEVKRQASQTIRLFYETADDKLKQPIEIFVLERLKKVLEPVAPPEISRTGEWDEESIKHCLLPYLNLLPANHQMIHNLASVYVATNANVKRVILRSLEVPVKGMGMASPQLLLLVESCPKGAETLVTRIIHILTDKQPPSTDLVARVRDLYQKRVPDVRFLIPVLNGLTKKEVIDALPKLIMLNPVVVKEVFNRLLCDTSTTGCQGPLSPSELLVALHNIDTNKCDMKTVIKATGLCFAEKNIYTAEVLAVVMQLLMEQNPIPTLLMRTVIQSLSLYPRLIGFVMNILQRLILKQVWKESKLWEGFIKCCQRTQPQSFQVLLQLPAAQLRTVFATCADFKPALQEYIQTLTESQRSHIPQSILDAIFTNANEYTAQSTHDAPSDQPTNPANQSEDTLETDAN